MTTNNPVMPTEGTLVYNTNLYAVYVVRENVEGKDKFLYAIKNITTGVNEFLDFCLPNVINVCIKYDQMLNQLLFTQNNNVPFTIETNENKIPLQ